MKINFEEFEKITNEGKWFDFDTTLGNISLKLKLPDKEGFLQEVVKNVGNPDVQYGFTKKRITENTVDWKGIEDQNGKSIPFSVEIFKNPKFFGLFYDIKVTDESGKKSSFILSVFKILSDSSRFLGAGESSFLESTCKAGLTGSKVGQTPKEATPTKKN